MQLGSYVRAFEQHSKNIRPLSLVRALTLKDLTAERMLGELLLLFPFGASALPNETDPSPRAGKHEMFRGVESLCPRVLHDDP